MLSEILKDNVRGSGDEVAQRIFKLLREPKDAPLALGCLLFTEDNGDLQLYASGEREYTAPLVTMLPQLLATLLIDRKSGDAYDGPVWVTRGPTEDCEQAKLNTKFPAGLAGSCALLGELQPFTLLVVNHPLTGWPRTAWPMYWVTTLMNDPDELWLAIQRWAPRLQGRLNAAYLDCLDWAKPELPTFALALRYRLAEKGALRSFEGGDTKAENPEAN